MDDFISAVAVFSMKLDSIVFHIPVPIACVLLGLSSSFTFLCVISNTVCFFFACYFFLCEVEQEGHLFHSCRKARRRCCCLWWWCCERFEIFMGNSLLANVCAVVVSEDQQVSKPHQFTTTVSKYMMPVRYGEKRIMIVVIMLFFTRILLKANSLFFMGRIHTYYLQIIWPPRFKTKKHRHKSCYLLHHPFLLYDVIFLMSFTCQ